MPSHEKLAEDLLRFYPRDFGTEYEANKEKLKRDLDENLNAYFDLKWGKRPSAQDIRRIAGIITRYAVKNATASADWREELGRVGHVVSDTEYDIDGAHSPGKKRKMKPRYYPSKRHRGE